jgi:predicted dehydrogenase
MERTAATHRRPEHRPHATSRAGEVRFGLIGCGRLAERGWLVALERVPGARLVAVADPDPRRREAPRHAERRYPSGEELMAAGGVDAVIVASPARAHLDNAQRAAAAGLPCLVEKPPAPDLAGAVALANLRPLPWLGLNRRFDPALQDLRRRVPASGPVSLDLRLRYRRGSWSPHVVRDDALLDLGPHLIDLAGWLTGTEPARARATELGPARATLELELSGGRGRATIECATDRPYLERFKARASERGGAVARGGLLRAIWGRIRPPEEHPLVASLVGQLESLVGALGGAPAGPLATARDGVPVMATVEAVRRSATRGGAWEPVDPEAAAEAQLPC